ncbi:MAG: hypothetical protein WBM14_08275 [Terracidiphilus sp.]
MRRLNTGLCLILLGLASAALAQQQPNASRSGFHPVRPAMFHPQASNAARQTASNLNSASRAKTPTAQILNSWDLGV